MKVQHVIGKDRNPLEEIFDEALEKVWQEKELYEIWKGELENR